MKTKNNKRTNRKSTINGNKFDNWQSKIPTCPLCGNTKMNYYISEKKVWKCSKAHLHVETRVNESLIKYVA